MLADELDAEALRNSAGRELFTNPAKALAERMSGRESCWRVTTRRRWHWPATARAMLLRIAHQAVTAVGLADALVALRSGMGDRPDCPALIMKSRYSTTSRSTARCRRGSGPSSLTTDDERPVVLARVSGLDDVDVINAEDVPEALDMVDAPVAVAPPGRPEQQLATLAVRLEMTATYLRLVRG